MAEKKTTAKKKSTTKKAVSKKAVKKSTLNNKKVNSKKVNKNLPSKESEKHVKKTSKHVKNADKKSDRVSKDSGNNWGVISVILIVLIVILVAVIGWTYFGENNLPNDDLNNTSNDNVEIVNDPNQESLLIIEDPECKVCQVDMFVEQMKQNLMPNLTVQQVSSETSQGQALIQTLQVEQLPVYLFSSAIDKRDDWEKQLSQAFIKIEINNESFYMLNPQFIPNKVLVNEPKITDDAIIIGKEDAPITLVEFTDFECPYCAIAEGNPEMVAQFQQSNPDYVAPIPKIYEEYVKKGDVKIVFYNNPIAGLHPYVRIAHLSGLCAEEQNKFKEFSHLVWVNRNNWSSIKNNSERLDVYKNYAEQLDLDMDKFSDCVDSNKYDKQISEEIQLAQQYGVTGTPSFIVDKVFISGAQDYTVFKEIIDAGLARE